MPVAGFRFALVGLANTAIGFTLIALGLLLGMNDYAANAMGYGLGLGVSYALNRSWTFKADAAPSTAEFGRFAASFAIAYTANIAVLSLGRAAGLAGEPALHLAGLAVYSVLLFVLMRTIVFGQQIKISDNQRVAFACIGVAFVALLIIAQQRLTHDVVWQFWIARQMLGGAELYVDIMEINPPLWFWMALGITHIAALFGMTELLLLKVILIALAAFSVLLADSLSTTTDVRSRIVLALASFVVIALLPIYDFGQREHLVLITALPYCALIGARSRNEPVAFGKAMVIGLLAATGFALKHYFTVVPILLEATLFLFVRREYRLFRPETIALALCAMLYGAVIIILTPAFISQIVPMVRLAYDGYQKPLITQIIGWHQLVIYGVIIALVLYRRLFRFRQNNVVCYLVASFGFGLAYFAQQKGWQYHAVPVTGLLLVSLIALMIEARERAVPARSMLLGWFALISAIAISLIWIGPYRSGEEKAFDFAMQDLAPGDTVFAVSTGPRIAWPMVEEHDLVWPSRYFTLWTTVATEIPTGSTERRAELEDLAQTVRTNTLHDLSCHPPKVIIVERPLRNAKLNASDFSYMAYLRKDAGLSQFFASYRHAGWESGIDKFVLADPASLPPKPDTCREIEASIRNASL